ncbi:hypothetical protein JCM6292_1705 [Bacteroides pyogenes JCM 6292]|uniref:Uncharacterized protein n=2 Tax=Bacteroides pyogenes TaxID=310300 RepID=W4PH76_9BACE|nr:hypothetical protein JCM6292_1705 [Bacteroides pyogenes JCM 6292]GAE19035.1 hypothetical protein JCM6294_2036 [Bacteroides pyogenes DSM 20611 = JCM 6294]
MHRKMTGKGSFKEFPTIETKVSPVGNFIFPVWKLLFPKRETKRTIHIPAG